MNGEEPMTFMQLPNELILNCLARVSRLYYPTLSLVSKRFRSLLVSPELYKIRTLLGCTESCLYVCVSSSSDSKPHWFTLFRRPNRSPKPRWFTLCFKPDTNHTSEKNKKKKKSSDNVLIPIPSTNSPFLTWVSGFAAVGSSIYHIGHNTNKVSFLDCRFHTWHEAPRMMMATRTNLFLVGVLDEKIYVVKNSKERDLSPSSSWIEFFDPKTQIWENMKIPSKFYISKCLAMEGNLYFDLWRSNTHLVYKPKENSWHEVEPKDIELRWNWVDCCVIDGVVFGFNSGKLKWYDSKGRCWRKLNSVKGGLPKFPKSPHLISVKLADYDGNIAVFWYKNWTAKLKIWCAEITLEKRNEQEIWGKVE